MSLIPRGFQLSEHSSTSEKIIDTLTGEPGQRATESFTSVTQGLEATRILDHERYESRIVLVETPGFNHSSKTDEEILSMIREWLEKTSVEFDLCNKYYPGNHICADTRNGYDYRALCTSTESPIR